MPFIDINGARFYYEIAGDILAETVVFLHAGIADRRMWDRQIDPFSAHYRVLCYDLRGFGRTTVSTPVPYSHHEDLHTLLNQLGIRRAALIGCSNGGRVAMNFALAYPEIASALVMVCSSPGGYRDDSEDPPIRTEIVAAFDAGDLELTAELEAQLWAVGPDRSPENFDPSILSLVREMNLIALKNEVLANSGTEQPFPPAAEHVEELHLPVLAVVGELDSPVTLTAGKFMVENIAGAQQVMMQTAHLPSMEQPDEFNRLVLNFLKDAFSR